MSQSSNTDSTEQFEPDYSITLGVPAFPAKKNQWRRSKHGGLYLPSACRAAMNDLTLQARCQWGHGSPLENPAIALKLWLLNLRRDPDGIWTTLCDVLQDAGVIRNDNAKRLGGPSIRLPIVVGAPYTRREYAVIMFWQDWQKFGRWVEIQLRCKEQAS